MSTTETGVFTETYSRGEAASEAGTLTEMIKRLTADIGTLISLKLELLKAELTESVSGYAKDGAMLAAAAVMAVLAVVFLNVTLVFFLAWLLPFSGPMNYACAALIVTMLHVMGAAIIAMIVKKRLANRTLVPTRTVEELKRDKQWVTETVM